MTHLGFGVLPIFCHNSLVATPLEAVWIRLSSICAKRSHFTTFDDCIHERRVAPDASRSGTANTGIISLARRTLVLRSRRSLLVPPMIPLMKSKNSDLLSQQKSLQRVCVVLFAPTLPVDYLAFPTLTPF